MSSSYHRQKGNEVFKRLVGDVSRNVLLDRFEECVRHYHAAKSTATSEADLASANKNLYNVHMKYICMGLGSVAEAQYHLRMMWLAHGDAYRSGKACKPLEWLQELTSRAEERLGDVLDTLRSHYDMDGEACMHALCSLCFSGVPTSPVMHCRLNSHVGLLMFQRAAVALEKKEYMHALSVLGEAQRSCVEAAQAMDKLGADGVDVSLTLSSEVEVLQEDITRHTFIARSQQSLAQAKQHFEEAILGDDTLNMTLIYHALDSIRYCTQLAEGKDVETEAEAWALLGRIYAGVLKQPLRGKEFCQQSIRLALSMAPKNFGTVDWFVRASEFVREQNERRDREDSAWKTEHLEALKDELDTLRTMAASAKEQGKVTPASDDAETERNKKEEDKTHLHKLLEHLYTKHAPKDATYTLEFPIDGNEKTRLKKALFHYHPDKTANKCAEDRWRVFFEEATKILTGIFELHK
ncbi:hypothetical protein PTSG_06797 [Salpingoeca rosetta]|uniref:J domain-containing protein n=1 Tax=Salpingoeca rosetta (strain ATCC 50818 / BSB-021) TaxID=946362 RepID=F2UEU2_SALR5|nr:uncharacterized protein PTSG_06797 [Salpingoeca rosetta]EGD75142.1 hypothetical protein PTSG_06797 [Salpingoeca rosetta]|eukprot:XP_004992195.1 hypothetical protein PTSG_06797 [Salpingoeca rosetta]